MLDSAKWEGEWSYTGGKPRRVCIIVEFFHDVRFALRVQMNEGVVMVLSTEG